MHCINVIPKALSPGKERGASLLIGGKNTLKVGVNLGSMMIPFIKLDTDEEVEEFIETMDEIIDWWDENGLDHERVGETIERVGMKQFLEAVGEKIGFKTNLVAINPLNSKEKVPVYFANFVLMDYGFGAVFGCPAHDQRDFDFAKKYKLEIKTVVKPYDEDDNFKFVFGPRPLILLSSESKEYFSLFFL